MDRTRETAVGAGHDARGLHTARAALQILTLLMRKPEGVSAEEVAASVGKSVSTAYNLLASLCEEGFAVHEAKGIYRPAPALRRVCAVEGHDGGAEEQAGLADAADDLFERTRKRVFVALPKPDGITLALTRGRQGLPRIQGLGREISDSAHALAVGKIVLAHLGRAGLERHLRQGLRTFTPNTIVRPERLAAELIEVRRTGLATDREEYDEDVCCMAVALSDRRRQFVAAIGVSMTARAYHADGDAVAAALREVATVTAEGLRAGTPAGVAEDA